MLKILAFVTTLFCAMSANAFRITLDYQFAPEIGNDPVKRGVMEAAAREWEKLLSPTHFPTISQSTTFRFYDSYARQYVLWNATVPVGDVTVAVRWQSISGATAVSSPSTYPWGGSWSARWSVPFQPWSGYLLMNSNINWWWDQTPETDDDIPPGSIDALDTAMHELGHVLGFCCSPFNSLKDANGDFAGQNAMAWNDGPIPMNNTHIAEEMQTGHMAGMKCVMQAGGSSDFRRYPGWCEAMILKDLGYSINEDYLFSRSFKDAQRAWQIVE